MTLYPTFTDILQNNQAQDSMSPQEEQDLIFAAEEMAIQIETNETEAYMSAASVILNC